MSRIAEELHEAGQVDASREAKQLERVILSAAEGQIRVLSVESDEEMNMLRRWVMPCTSSAT
jgi:hypothetical protein